jgi:hypothetical protein
LLQKIPEKITFLLPQTEPTIPEYTEADNSREKKTTAPQYANQKMASLLFIHMLARRWVFYVSIRFSSMSVKFAKNDL